MRIQINKFIDSILVAAIAVSIVWHIFWLSAVKVVIIPKEGAAAKFPKVSFLGPILGKGALEVQITPRQHSFTEKRFYEMAEKLEVDFKSQAKDASLDDSLDTSFYALNDGKISPLIKRSINDSKTEPHYRVE